MFLLRGTRLLSPRAPEAEFHENGSNVNFAGAEELDVPLGLRRRVPGRGTDEQKRNTAKGREPNENPMEVVEDVPRIEFSSSLRKRDVITRYANWLSPLR